MAPMLTKRCLLSSTFDDLQEERDAAAESIERAGFFLVAMERFPTNPSPPGDLTEQLVASSDVVVLVVGNRLGTPIPGRQQTFVEAEYEAARRRSLPVHVFISR